jgi:hypothetical protein
MGQHGCGVEWGVQFDFAPNGRRAFFLLKKKLIVSEFRKERIGDWICESEVLMEIKSEGRYEERFAIKGWRWRRK